MHGCVHLSSSVDMYIHPQDLWRMFNQHTYIIRPQLHVCIYTHYIIQFHIHLFEIVHMHHTHLFHHLVLLPLILSRAPQCSSKSHLRYYTISLPQKTKSSISNYCPRIWVSLNVMVARARAHTHKIPRKLCLTSKLNKLTTELTSEGLYLRTERAVMNYRVTTVHISNLDILFKSSNSLLTTVHISKKSLSTE
jgi:hypothetical protein